MNKFSKINYVLCSIPQSMAFVPIQKTRGDDWLGEPVYHNLEVVLNIQVLGITEEVKTAL